MAWSVAEQGEKMTFAGVLKSSLEICDSLYETLVHRFSLFLKLFLDENEQGDKASVADMCLYRSPENLYMHTCEPVQERLWHALSKERRERKIQPPSAYNIVKSSQSRLS